jgi:hypothetical protein
MRPEILSGQNECLSPYSGCTSSFGPFKFIVLVAQIFFIVLEVHATENIVLSLLLNYCCICFVNFV